MRAARLVLLAVLVASAAARSGQDKPASQPAPGTRPKSFVRMDLLTKPARELAPPKRGIFAPSAEDTGEEAGDAGATAIPAADIGGHPGAPGQAGAAAPATSALPSLSIRYIGYIKSPRGIVGLVLVQGLALAVATDDVVADWYKVGTITPQEIEILGSDGSKLTYPLEGDEE